MGIVGCKGWRGANVETMAAPISTQDVGSEVALRVEVSVISWAGVGVGRDDMMIWFCELDATYNIKE